MNANQKLLTTAFVMPNRLDNLWAKVKTISFEYGQIVFGVLGVLVILFCCQILAIAVADRIGISPKISVLVSSSIYILVLLGLAIYARLQTDEKTGVLIQQKEIAVSPDEPICKILMIRKKGV